MAIFRRSSGTMPSETSFPTFTVEDEATKRRRTPAAGEIFKNPALAKTLEAVQQGGASEFYNGSVARAYAAYAIYAVVAVSLDGSLRSPPTLTTQLSCVPTPGPIVQRMCVCAVTTSQAVAVCSTPVGPKVA